MTSTKIKQWIGLYELTKEHDQEDDVGSDESQEKDDPFEDLHHDSDVVSHFDVIFQAVAQNDEQDAKDLQGEQSSIR